jgi:phosphatidylglycerophosphatase C
VSADGSEPLRGVAAFDFDGTVTRGDTLLGFLERLCGRRRVAAALAAESAALLGLARRTADRDAVKARLLARLLGGWGEEDLALVVQHYTEFLIDRRLRRDVLQRLTCHRGRGHELVLVSASPEIYVAPTARRLGFDKVFATRLERSLDGHLTGHLEGVNVRGSEKARLLAGYLGEGPVELWAYGNSSGDREMLAMAQNAFLVTRRGVCRWPPGGTAAGRP